MRCCRARHESSVETGAAARAAGPRSQSTVGGDVGVGTGSRYGRIESRVQPSSSVSGPGHEPMADSGNTTISDPFAFAAAIHRPMRSTFFSCSCRASAREVLVKGTRAGANCTTAAR